MKSNNNLETVAFSNLVSVLDTLLKRKKKSLRFRLFVGNLVNVNN